MTVIGVLITFVVFIGVASVINTMDRKEKDVEHSGLYRQVRFVTKA
jgi:hypothetical protein